MRREQEEVKNAAVAECKVLLAAHVAECHAKKAKAAPKPKAKAAPKAKKKAAKKKK